MQATNLLSAHQETVRKGANMCLPLDLRLDNGEYTTVNTTMRTAPSYYLFPDGGLAVEGEGDNRSPLRYLDFSNRCGEPVGECEVRVFGPGFCEKPEHVPGAHVGTFSK